MAVKDKCKKEKDCGCGCDKKPKRKRVAKPKTGSKAKNYSDAVNFAAAKMIGFNQPFRAPFMAPINYEAPTRVAPTPIAKVAGKPFGTQTDVSSFNLPKPAKYSRIPITTPTPVVSTIPKEPMSRYASKIVAMNSVPASTIQSPMEKPVKEKKKFSTTEDITRPSVMKGIDTSMSKPLKERKSINVSSTTPTLLGPDLVLPSVRMPLERITNRGPQKLTSQYIFKPSPTKLKKEQSGEPNTLLFKSSGGSREGAGRPKYEPTHLAPPYEKPQ